jgi:hypothetical protein
VTGGCDRLDAPEPPSLAAVWTPFDAGGAWKIVSAKELQAAGYEIDWNKVTRAVLRLSLSSSMVK